MNLIEQYNLDPIKNWKVFIYKNQETNYIISDHGDVFSKYSNICLKFFTNDYHCIKLCINKCKKHFRIHRLVALCFLPNTDHYPIVNHKDGNKLNNHVSNLEWYSCSQNVQHAHDNNLIKKRTQNEKSEEDISWKFIPGYEELYRISQNGDVYSCKLKRILKNSLKGMYYGINLSKNLTRKTYKIHRLVALTYISNPNNYIVINHIDENKLNNHINNLEWCTHSQNTQQVYENNKINQKSILQYDLNGDFINEYKSISVTAKIFNVSNSSITKNCFGDTKICKGYIFKFKNPYKRRQRQFISFRKPVFKMDKNTNKIIGKYDSIMNAALDLKKEDQLKDKNEYFLMSHIGNTCNKREKSAYGYKWKFV